MNIPKSKILLYKKTIREFVEKEKDENGNNFFSFKFIGPGDDIYKDPNALDSLFRSTNGLRKWSAYGRYDFLFFVRPVNGKQQFVESMDFFNACKCEEKLHYNHNNNYPLKHLSDDLKEIARSGKWKDYPDLRFMVDIFYIILYSREERKSLALNMSQLEKIKLNAPKEKKRVEKSSDIYWDDDDDYDFLLSILSNPHNQQP